MSNPSKNILRGVIVLTYIIIMAVVIYGLAAIFTYLNTGADRSTMLHTEIKQVEHYLPKVVWAPLNNVGRPMDTQTLKSIEDDYLDAWYVKHVAFKSNTTTGIDDYYTESARENLYNIITINSENENSIDATTLFHNITLEFFSEDGQLVVLTDKDVVEYKRLFKSGKYLTEINEISTYKITLLLEDGFWRIRHLVREKSETHNPKVKNLPINSSELKGINYYPQDSPWDMYGDKFDASIIDADFKVINEAGLNSIRIFVPYEDFGKSSVTPDKLEKLKNVLDLAHKNRLKVLVTLFDFYGDYSVLDWSLTQRHAESVINYIKNHQALLGWDIKNEPNLDFESRGKELVLAWLDKMVAHVKAEDPNHPVTIGWSNVESATLLKDKLDFISFHYYKDLDQLEPSFNSLKATTNQPVIVTEFGLSSYNGFWNPFGNSDEDQAKYHKDIQTIFKTNGIPYMSWTLYDFTEVPKEVVGGLPWRKNAQKHFGFIDKNGLKKASFKFISSKE
ncbi:glycoside hydrolase family 2 TIM barrel-domain containing protein [Winogradskyella alexanderae]|uniref:Cellulase family glycosylhydrolase n=1 Tax=Winogradskyella alexanderae TaxID=2877123 RepID=A0ABS7XRG3_9FLAO|nr:glycoside hydrolase family 2 TIM barrel-domain containing protein [Winogradskyella alexanderae]MCA0132595.1 cellulase family glycosylhydrolase [Winogradskyella alexanderae]